MKNYRKVISVIAVLIGLFVMSVSVSAADLAIIVVDGKAVVGNGTSGVAIVASYDEDGKLQKFLVYNGLKVKRPPVHVPRH